MTSTIQKRASALEEGIVIADGNALEDAVEREAAVGDYALGAEGGGPVIYTFASSRMATSAALLTGILQTLSATTVKPVAQTQVISTSWGDLVRQAEGPAEYGRRGRYVAYTFGGAGGRTRQFWDGQ